MSEQDCVLITGAGSGLGRALAVAFTNRGMLVVGAGRNMAALEETKALAKQGLFEAAACDVSNAGEVKALFDRLEHAGRQVAILFNNAAIYQKAGFSGNAAGRMDG